MRKQWKKWCAAALAAVLMASVSLGQTAFASLALGSELVEERTWLAPGLELVEGSLWSATYSDLRTEHYLTYTPGSGVSPMVFSGTYVASTNSLVSAAGQMEAAGWRVAAGVNGGFFNYDGTIVGLLLTEGVLRSVDVGNATMLGIRGDGSFFVDESPLTKTVSWNGEQLSFQGFNAYRTAAGLYLYNEDFSSKVNTSGPCVYAILRPQGDGALTMNGSVTMTVESVTDTFQEGVAFNGYLPSGSYMLYAAQDAGQELLDKLRALQPGTQVTVSVTGGRGDWSDAQYGITGLETLVRNGQVVSGLPGGAAPRTAVGLKADGSVIVYTIDGRQSGYSVGATYTQVAQRLVELGCVTAVGLDGGGSTALGATLPGEDSFGIVSRPSQSNRRLNNCILFLTSSQPTGVQAGYAVEPDSQVVLTGGSISLTAAAYDTAGYAMQGEQPVWSAAGGTIQSSGGNSAVYTAGDTPGTYEIQASGAGTQGSCTVRVVDSLSSISVTRASNGAQVSRLTLKAGESVQLSISGKWYNLPAAVSGGARWSADSAIGTVDSSGRFTAGSGNAQGSILVSAGGRTVNITVTVSRGDPFTDMGGHWASDYVTKLYQLGITQGFGEEDGTYTFRPNAQMSRGELLVFLARLLDVDTGAYEGVELPFADSGSIAGWMLPSVKALYALGVFQGSGEDGALYARVDQPVTREAAMTMMGRVLAGTESCDLSAFADADQVSPWAAPYVQTLVARGVVQGSDGRLNPQENIDRGSAAKLLVMIYDMEKAPLSHA